MKIICKYKDFYDYFQGIYIDDTIVFDRRNCMELTENDFKTLMSVEFRYNYNVNLKEIKNVYFMLQIGYTNWLFEIKINSIYDDGYKNIVDDYSIKLIEKWKDYNNCYKCRFGQVIEHYSIEQMTSKKFNHNEALIDRIKQNNYRIKDCFDSYNENSKFDIIPIFSKTKIPSLVDAFEVYQSFEEYFSHLKDDVNCDKMTDKEKIESHGFDKEYSFRSKK